jgi:hypothetical protein
MDTSVGHVNAIGNLVEGTPPPTSGFWFYFGFFYASPAVLVEQESCTT